MSEYSLEEIREMTKGMEEAIQLSLFGNIFKKCGCVIALRRANKLDRFIRCKEHVRLED